MSSITTTTTARGRAVTPSRLRRIVVAGATAGTVVLGGIAVVGAIDRTDPPSPAALVQPASDSEPTRADAVDVDAVWQTIRQLDGAAASAILPALDGDVLADLEAMVQATAGASLGR